MVFMNNVILYIIKIIYAFIFGSAGYHTQGFGVCEASTVPLSYIPGEHWWWQVQGSMRSASKSKAPFESRVQQSLSLKPRRAPLWEDAVFT
jgi:hypothetical protein